DWIVPLSMTWAKSLTKPCGAGMRGSCAAHVVANATTPSAIALHARRRSAVAREAGAVLARPRRPLDAARCLRAIGCEAIDHPNNLFDLSQVLLKESFHVVTPPCLR